MMISSFRADASARRCGAQRTGTAIKFYDLGGSVADILVHDEHSNSS